MEMFNFKNKTCQDAFFEENDTNKELLECFEDDNETVVVQASRWRKTFKNILHKCFRKIRIVKRKQQIKSDDMLKERIKLKNEANCTAIDEEMKDKIEERIRQIEDEIGEDTVKENHKAIVDTINELGDG
jgi:uncharacterized membrane-anchored protein YjiN (DUF445 family)